MCALLRTTPLYPDSELRPQSCRESRTGPPWEWSPGRAGLVVFGGRWRAALDLSRSPVQVPDVRGVHPDGIEVGGTLALTHLGQGVPGRLNRGRLVRAESDAGGDRGTGGECHYDGTTIDANLRLASDTSNSVVEHHLAHLVGGVEIAQGVG